MASKARSTVGTEFYHAACTNNSIVIVQLVKILRSKVTWSEQIKSIPLFQHITIVQLSQKDTKSIPQTHITTCTSLMLVLVTDTWLVATRTEVKQSKAIPWFSHWFLTEEACVQTQASPCQICREQGGIGKGICPSTSVFPPININPPMAHLVNWPAQFYSQNHVTTLSARRSTATIEYQCCAWCNDITLASSSSTVTLSPSMGQKERNSPNSDKNHSYSQFIRRSSMKLSSGNMNGTWHHSLQLCQQDQMHCLNFP
jgi:hypothetical protein